MSDWAGYSGRRNSKPGSPFAGQRAGGLWSGGAPEARRKQLRSGGSPEQGRHSADSSRRADFGARLRDENSRRHVENLIDGSRRPSDSRRADASPLRTVGRPPREDDGYRRVGDAEHRPDHDYRGEDERYHLTDGGSSRLDDGRRRVDEGPRSVSRGSRRLDSGLREVDDDSRRINDSLRRDGDGPRRVGDSPDRVLQDIPRRVDGGPRRVDDGPRRFDDGPRRVDDVPRRVDDVPRRVEDGPRRVDDGPRRVDDGPRRVDDGPRRVDDGPRRVDDGPRRVDDGPRRVDDGPRRIGLGPRRSDGVPRKVDGSPHRMDLALRRSDDLPQHGDIVRRADFSTRRVSDAPRDRVANVRNDHREEARLGSAFPQGEEHYRSSVPEKRVRLNGGESSQQVGYSPTTVRNVADDLERGEIRERAVHIVRSSSIGESRRQSFDDEDSFVSRTADRTVYDVKYDRSRRHSDKMEAHADKFSRDSEHTAVMATASQRKAPERDTIDEDEHHGSGRSGSSAAAAVPYYRSNAGSEPFPYETYPDGDNLFNFGADVSDQAIEKRAGASVAGLERPREQFDYRAGDGSPRPSEHHGGSSSKHGKRSAGRDLREEVLGGRRYRGTLAVAGNVDVGLPVQHESPDSALPQGGSVDTRELPHNRRVPTDMPERRAVGTAVRAPAKRVRSSSPRLPARHGQFMPVSPRDVTRAASRRKYVIERLVTEEDRIRSLALNRHPAEIVSHQELDKCIQELWLNFCDRELDAEASAQRQLFLEYMDMYYDVLLDVYPHFSEYYSDCKDEEVGLVAAYPAEHAPRSSRRPVVDVRPPAAASAAALSNKRLQVDQAAFLVKKAKGQKHINRNLTVVKIEESAYTLANAASRVQHISDKTPRAGSSYAPDDRALQSREQHLSSSGLAVATARRSHPSSQYSLRETPAESSKAVRHGSIDDTGNESALKRSDRAPTLPDTQRDAPTSRHPGSKEVRPTVLARPAKTDQPAEGETWKQSSERLQGTSLVAVADAAAATSAKTVFDDPFMKFLHTTLTAMIVIGELQRQQISGRLTANHQKSLAEERTKMEARMRTDMGHKLIKLARCIQEGALDAAKKTLDISDQILKTVANLDPVVIRTIACTPLLR